MIKTGRISGILMPLFSLRSRTDFGVGDFGAIDGLLAWMAAAKQRMLMLLPLLPTAPNDSSPYATQSAFGLNPLFIDIAVMPEFQEAGGFEGLPASERAQLELARASKSVRYDLVLPLKRTVLRRAFDLFHQRHWQKKDARAEEFEAYRRAQADWLDDYALFAAISTDQLHRPWWDWAPGLRDRMPAALAAERARLERDVLFHAWMQWVCERQWLRVRAKARELGILVCGDEPFIIGQDSMDVWANPSILRRDGRLGVPPDPFSATGQDWGLPYFDFAAMKADDYGWLRFRARKAASYYDLRRVDHAVGYFRQWVRDDAHPTGRFIPDDEPSQRELGERHFKLLSEGTGIVAEDLGVIPDFVREKLTALGLPGYRVMRWERDDDVYRDPHAYPALSLATTGTHDTESVREWWEQSPEAERVAMAEVYPELKRLTPLPKTFTPSLHEALLAAAENSGSDLCVLPWQDVLGTTDRVNLPGSHGDGNWAYRITQMVEELLAVDETRKAAELLARLTVAARRA